MSTMLDVNLKKKEKNLEEILMMLIYWKTYF